jgi:hypothetical protein
MLVAAAVELPGHFVEPAGAPLRPWGARGIATDARVAVLFEEVNGRSEAILIDGSWLAVGGVRTVVSSPAPLPIVRQAVADPLASTVHAPAGTR